jgi:UDP-glucose 4-epimerase
MKKVLITGGLGFIGCHLAEACIEKNFDVTIITRSLSKKENINKIKNKVKLVEKDIKDINVDVVGFDYIFHLAGSTDNYAIIEGTPYKDIEMNCVPTIALLEAIKKHNPKTRLIFASTFFVNGRPDALPVTPTSPCNPLGLYGATRLVAEHFCHIYHNNFDLDIVIARFTNVFGDREKGNDKKKAGFNYMIREAVLGKDIYVYNNGDFFRDYIYVTDVVSACLTIAEKGKTNEIYYVVRGEFVKFKELVKILLEQTGTNSISINPPDFHNKVGIKDFVADVSNLKKLGWSPKVSLRDGIIRTIKYYNGSINIKNE